VKKNAMEIHSVIFSNLLKNETKKDIHYKSDGRYK